MGKLTQWDAPEWLRDLRGFPAYYLHAFFHSLSFLLLPYAGDWACREERRAWRREQAAGRSALKEASDGK